MNKGWILAILFLVLVAASAVASAQNVAGEVTKAHVIYRGRSFLQNAPPRSLAPEGPERMKPPREADYKRDLIKAMRESMRAATPSINLEWAQASVNANVVSGGTALTFKGLDIVDQEFDSVLRYGTLVVVRDADRGIDEVLYLNRQVVVYFQDGRQLAGTCEPRLHSVHPRRAELFPERSVRAV